MASNGTSHQQVVVNGANGIGQSTQNDITLALLQNGGIKRIETTLRQRLDEAGWSQELREYCTRLFRSGDAVTYDDALSLIMRNINSEGAPSNGSANGAQIPDLSIPRHAAEDAAEAVRKELTQVVKIRK